MTGTTPAPAADPERIADLRHDLIEADYTNDGVAALLGADVVHALDRDQIAPGQLRIAELVGRAGDGVQDRLAVLVSFWLLDVPVSRAQLDAALPRTGAAGLQELGLLQPVASRHSGEPKLPSGELLPSAAVWGPAVELRPYQSERSTTGPDGDRRSPTETHPTAQHPTAEHPAAEGAAAGSRDLWISSDLSAHQLDGPLPHDHVLGLGQATLTLASVTERRHVETALDLGTGCGVHVFLLLDHADHVVATDISPRALAFTRFNLLLNADSLGLDPHRLDDRVELLQGNLLEPVQGRRFDLIISNPPFVITPRSPSQVESSPRYVYRDGGATGDAIVQQLVEGLPALLRPGGTAQMLGNWEVTGEEWEQRPLEWAQTAAELEPVDVWFIQRDRTRPGEYAETWLRDASEGRDLMAYRARYAEYLRDFASRGVQEIGYGIIQLRRRPVAGGVPPWTRTEELTHPLDSPLGPHLGEAMRRMTEVAEQPGEVLARPLTVAENVTEERHQRFGAQHPEVILARQGSGLRRAVPVSSAAAGLLGAADGEFALDSLISAVCSLLAVTDAEQEHEGGSETSLEESVREEVLQLYARGFLRDANPSQGQ